MKLLNEDSPLIEEKENLNMVFNVQSCVQQCAKNFIDLPTAPKLITTIDTLLKYVPAPTSRAEILGAMIQHYKADKTLPEWVDVSKNTAPGRKIRIPDIDASSGSQDNSEESKPSMAPTPPTPENIAESIISAASAVSTKGMPVTINITVNNTN